MLCTHWYCVGIVSPTVFQSSSLREKRWIKQNVRKRKGQERQGGRGGREGEEVEREGREGEEVEREGTCREER